MNRAAPDPIKVLIVEDSDVVRLLLERIIASDSRLAVAGSVANGHEALAILDELSPDVISMDIRMPRMDGFETTRQIMATRPTPIVVVSASVEAEDLKISMNALRAGALTVVEKPVGLSHADYDRLARTLCQQLVLMSGVKLIRQRPRLVAGPAAARPVAPACPTLPSDTQATAAPAGGRTVVGLVASTGGPAALATVLGSLGEGFPLPCLVVQHMTASFLAGFVAWLDSVVPLPVRLAADGDRPQAGCVYLAPADGSLRLIAGRLRVADEAPFAERLSAGSALLESIASSAGPRGIGVLLTGMGQDGAAGLLAMHRSGAHTIAEHESTAVIHGMPGAAVNMGAATEVLPLPRIGPRLLGLAASRRVHR